MAAYERAGESDEWYTPKRIFDALNVTFDLDVACPPFGHMSTKRAWLAKFFAHGDGIALLPDRTSAPWWQEAAPLAHAILFVNGKIKFERPDGSIGEQPGTGTCLFAAGHRAAYVLENCGLGFVRARP